MRRNSCRFPFACLLALALLTGAALSSPAQGTTRASPSRRTYIEKLTLTLTANAIAVSKEKMGHSDCVVAPGTKELLAVDNHKRKTIDVLDLDGNFKRTMSTQGFHDMEGLVHVHGNTFAAIDEKARSITTLTITPLTRRVSKRNGQTFKLNVPDTANHGLEGITYDSDNNCYYVANEGDPLAIFKVVLRGRTASATELFDAEQQLAGKCKDILDVVYDKTSQHLFFLSDISECIVETDLKGNVVSEHPIPSGLPEGIAFSPDRKHLYLIDQTGILYRYNVTWAQ